MKPKLLVTLPNHWSMKNLIHAGVFAKLLTAVEIEAWAEESKIPSIKEVLSQLGITEGVELRSYPENAESPEHRHFRLLQKSVLFERHGNATEKIVQKSFRGRRTVMQKLASTFIRPIARSPLGASWLRSLTAKRESLVPVYPDLSGQGYAGVLITNPFDFREEPFAAAGFRVRIPVLTMIPSWDNLTSKGVLLSCYDAISVWNAFTADELRRLYPRYRETPVDASGLSRMDAFSWPLPTEYQPAQLWPRLGLDANRKTILFANTATKSFPQQPQIVQHIIDEIKSGSLGDMQLLVRCHPHDNPADYENLDCAVWPSAADAPRAFGRYGCPPADDLVMLSAMIRNSDVVVNAASTIVLDAAACDKPIVSIAYDGDEQLNYYDSVANAYDYEHQKPFVDSGAGVLVRSKSELAAAIIEAVQNPEMRSAERKKLAAFASPGNSAERFAEFVLEHLEIRQEARV